MFPKVEKVVFHFSVSLLLLCITLFLFVIAVIAFDIINIMGLSHCLRLFSPLLLFVLVFEQVADRVDDNVGDHCVEDKVHDKLLSSVATVTLG